jgi:glycosyltransferase involved in cell wall biosynthesis
MPSPAVSVIVPTYNRAHFLPECLDSILAQSFSDFEVIIIDDGSTDGTRALVNSYTAHFGEKIRYFHQRNKGIAAARNKGIRAARGELIAFCDSDDAWPPGKLEHQVSVLGANAACAMVVGECVALGRETEGGFMISRATLEGKSFLEALFETQFVNLGATLFRASCLREIVDFDETLRTSEDYDLALRLAARFQAIVSRELALLYRRHGGNITSSPTACLNRYRVLLRFLREHPGMIPEALRRKRMREVCLGISDTLLEAGQSVVPMLFCFRSLRFGAKRAPVLKRMILCLWRVFATVK